MVTFSCLGFIRAGPNLDILDVKFDCNFIFEDHVRSVVSRVSKRIGILMVVKRINVDTSVLLRCYFAFVLPIFEYWSPVWGSAAQCHLQLLERHVYSLARLCPNQSFLLLCHRRRVAGLSILCKVNSNSNHCLFSELPSASTWVRHTRAVAATHQLEFEISRCRTSQVVFSSVFRGTYACGVAKAFFKQLCFSTWACAAGFNNNDNNDNFEKNVYQLCGNICWLPLMW